MAELLQDNALCAEIFDYLIIPSTVYGDQVRFGIQTNVSRISTNPRFARLFFRTRRPLEDFQDFVQFMASRHPDVIVPPLPFDEADPDEDRDLLLDKVALLHQYCTNLFEIQEIFDDPCLPLFVQSHRPMAEIREILANPEAAAASYGDYQRVLINDGNAQQAAAAAAANNDQQAPADDANAQQAAGNNDRQVPANDGNAQQAAAANNDRQVPANDGNAQQAAAVAGNNDRQVPANDGNAQPAAAAAAGNNDRQVPANDGNAQPAAAANNDQQVPPNDGNAQPAAAAANNDQQVPPNDGNAQQAAAAAAAANNDQKVPPNDGKAQQAAANNDQQVPANIRHAQHAAASNNQQVAAMRNQNGNESSEEDLTEGNLSGSESDETIFHMEDI